MRTKGSVSSVSVSLLTLNKVLKPNADIMVSKKFYDAISMLLKEEVASAQNSPILEKEDSEQEPIHVESL